MEIALKPVESLLFASDVVAVGSFRCPADDPLFRDSGPCSSHTFVFPRSMTRIRHEDGTSFVGSPNTIGLYNRGQRYQRVRISSIDATDWYVVSDDVLLDVLRSYDESVVERPDRPFPAASVAGGARLYLEQRRLFDQLRSNAQPEPIVVESLVLSFLTRVVEPLYARKRTAAPSRLACARVDEAMTVMGRNITRNIGLRELAIAAGCSPFQLCRSFREVTGLTPAHYRQELRLRASLERLRQPPCDLTTLALDLGYCSHSHFGASFRRSFGITPSAFRSMCDNAEPEVTSSRLSSSRG